MYRVATQCSLSSLELRVQFCLLVCCTYPSSSTVNKEKNLIDQRASLRVDTRETQQINWRRRHWADIGILYVISTELSLPDQKFFRIYSFDDGWNNGADQVACRPDTSPETADGTTSPVYGTTITVAQRRDGPTSTADAESTENLGRSKT